MLVETFGELFRSYLEPTPLLFQSNYYIYSRKAGDMFLRNGSELDGTAPMFNFFWNVPNQQLVEAFDNADADLTVMALTGGNMDAPL